MDKSHHVRAWVKRGEMDDPAGSDEIDADGRPLKRTKTFEGALAEENMLTTIGFGSLSQLPILPKTGVDLKSAFLWQLFLPTDDQGPDNVCKTNCYLRHLKRNIGPLWCQSHGAHNDVKQGLKDAGFWSHMTLMLMVWRAWRGHWS